MICYQKRYLSCSRLRRVKRKFQMRLGVKGCDLACGSRAGGILCTDQHDRGINKARKWRARRERTYTSNVSGYPAPTYDILMPVLFSELEKYWSMRPPCAPLDCGWLRWYLLSSSPSWSEPSVRRHFLKLELELEVADTPAVPNILRHSMSVLRGISNAALFASASSELFDSWEEELSGVDSER